MNAATGDVVAEKLNSLAQRLIDQGYDVKLHPMVADMPFGVDDYRPDLLAKKGGEGIMLDVKGTSARISIDRIQSVAQHIAAHAGWRFAMATLDDADLACLPGTDSALPTWETLSQKSVIAQHLTSGSLDEPALLYLCATLEGVLRRRAFEAALPIERLRTPALLDYLYSQGEISLDHYALARDMFIKRDRLAHGGMEQIAPVQLNDLIHATDALISEWRPSGPAALGG